MSSHRVEKDAVVDFAKYCDLRVRVQFQGGREVDGILRGFDKLDNLVLEDAVEYLRGKVIETCCCWWGSGWGWGYDDNDNISIYKWITVFSAQPTCT